MEIYFLLFAELIAYFWMFPCAVGQSNIYLNLKRLKKWSVINITQLCAQQLRYRSYLIKPVWKEIRNKPYVFLDVVLYIDKAYSIQQV